MSRMLAILSVTGLALCAAFLGLAFLIGGDDVFRAPSSLDRIKPLIDLATRKEWRWEGGDTLALNAPVNVRYQAKGPPRVSVTGPAEMMEHVRVSEGRIVSDAKPRRWEQEKREERLEAVVSGIAIRKFVVNGRENLDLGRIDQESLDVHLNGVGTVTGEGRVGELNLVIAGPGNADLGKLFVTADAKVSILGNGTASLAPQGDLRLFIAGNGKLSLLTRPRDISQTILGNGEVVAPPTGPVPQTRTETQTSTRTQTQVQTEVQVQTDVQIENKAQNRDFVVRGSGHVNFGHIDQDNVTISVFSSGTATAEGKADTLTVNIMGSGEAHLGKLSARRVEVVIRGSGEVTVAPREDLKVSIIGSGTVRLTTKPARIERAIRGSGEIIEAR